MEQLLEGMEQEQVQHMREQFCKILEECFPDKQIVWKNWDHQRLDDLGNALCKALGFAYGGDFLLSLGYTVVTNEGTYAPAQAVQKCKACRGHIVSLLSGRNSGFVRDDGDGKEYYFNVRSFRHWVKRLRVGIPVEFYVAERMDKHKGEMRLNAVELSCIGEEWRK